MKTKSLLKQAFVAALGLFSASSALAQNPVKENIAGNIGGTRFVVTAPSAIAGIKKINYATWGAAASPTISGKIIEKAYDTLGAATLLNGTGGYPTLTGKFALIFRGAGISFSDKVNRCIAAGAIGVIIVNNVPGDPVGMAPTPAGSTVAVPVFMISDVDGAAISNEIKAAPLGAGTVIMTLGTWNTGGTHDLGVLAQYQSTPHAMNIPLHQLKGSAGTLAYKHYVGGAVANYGAATETGVTVTDSVFWTPTGGSAAYVTNNSYTVASISVADSIRFGFGASAPYELAAPTTTGKYEHRYSASYGNTDDFPQDNKASITQYVTDSIFCKGRYDFTNNRPMVSLGIRPGVTPPVSFVSGDLFYIKNGNYAARKVQFSLSNDAAATLDGFLVNVFVSKWVDGAGGDLDSLVQAGELTPVGICAKSLTSSDSTGKTLTLDVLDIVNPTSGKVVKLDGNSWYYIGVEVPASLFIGIDESNSFFTRGYAQWMLGGAKPGAFVYETAVGLTTSDFATFTSTATNTLAPYPFSGNALYIDSAFYDRFNEVPSIALHMSKDTSTSIKNLINTFNGTTSVYPNPAADNINIELSLKEMSSKVNYRLTDLMGKTVIDLTHSNVLNEKFTMNLNGISSGNYYLLIVTDKGLDVKKVTVK